MPGCTSIYIYMRVEDATRSTVHQSVGTRFGGRAAARLPANRPSGGGSGEGIKAGTVGWVTLDLPAGRYELVCTLANHCANGMHRLLVVTGEAGASMCRFRACAFVRGVLAI